MPTNEPPRWFRVHPGEFYLAIGFVIALMAFVAWGVAPSVMRGSIDPYLFLTGAVLLFVAVRWAMKAQRRRTEVRLLRRRFDEERSEGI